MTEKEKRRAAHFAWLALAVCNESTPVDTTLQLAKLFASEDDAFRLIRAVAGDWLEGGIYINPNVPRTRRIWLSCRGVAAYVRLGLRAHAFRQLEEVQYAAQQLLHIHRGFVSDDARAILDWCQRVEVACYLLQRCDPESYPLEDYPF